MKEISCTTGNEREWCVVIRSRVLVVRAWRRDYERVVAIILGVSYLISTSHDCQRLTNRIPFPVHDSPVPSFLFGLPDTFAQSLWAHVPIRQP
jgi:hypothetical protein